VVKQLIDPDLEKIFLPDSYGYRPGKSALDAVGVTRERWGPDLRRRAKAPALQQAGLRPARGHPCLGQRRDRHRVSGAPHTASERALLAAIAQRAKKFYSSAQLLLPMIDRESRPALWVLVSIYHGLLKRIERADYDVFSSRVSVPLPQKLGILLVGLARMGWARLFT